MYKLDTAACINNNFCNGTTYNMWDGTKYVKTNCGPIENYIVECGQYGDPDICDRKVMCAQSTCDPIAGCGAYYQPLGTECAAGDGTCRTENICSDNCILYGGGCKDACSSNEEDLGMNYCVGNKLSHCCRPLPIAST